MKPIINPWLIYLIDLFDNLKDILGVVFILLGCAAVVLVIILVLFSDYSYDDDIIAYIKYLKKSVIWLCISGLLFAVVPSKDTMYTMIVLENVTTDSIQAVGKTSKDVVNYITDQIDNVVNDKEENKK